MRWRTYRLGSKGRVRRGSDASIAMFYSTTLSDRVANETARLTSNGRPLVIVSGEPFVLNGELVRSALPTHPVRGYVEAAASVRRRTVRKWLT